MTACWGSSIANCLFAISYSTLFLAFLQLTWWSLPRRRIFYLRRDCPARALAMSHIREIRRSLISQSVRDISPSLQYVDWTVFILFIQNKVWRAGLTAPNRLLRNIFFLCSSLGDPTWSILSRVTPALVTFGRHSKDVISERVLRQHPDRSEQISRFGGKRVVLYGTMAGHDRVWSFTSQWPKPFNNCLFSAERCQSIRSETLETHDSF